MGHLGVLIGGVVLIGQTFTDLAPEGPWDSASFTRGVLGLLGMLMVYMAWFKQTFGVYGVAPTVDRWKHPGAFLVARGCVRIDMLGGHPYPALD